MKLDFVSLDKLSVSRANMRHGKKPPDVSDILPTVRARGVLVPLIVRPQPCADALPNGGAAGGAGAEGGERAASPAGDFEIIAGRRRFHAASLVAEERRAANDDVAAEIVQLPCAILDEGDDADAIEASLIENLARLDPDEVTQWETFTRLVREGRRPEAIADTFGLPVLAVRRVLALGNLLPRIRELYRREQIDRATVRHLTLASRSQQKAWLALAEDESGYAPTGHQLKAWLFGGQSVSTAYALFDVEASGLAIVADLFGEDRYFADAEAFWAKQNEAIEAKRAAFIEDGWADAVIVPPAEHFLSWQYERASKRKGGRVYLDVRASGELVVHQGLVSRREAERLARGDAGVPEPKRTRPEVTSGMQTYIDLHRHAAVRAALTGQPHVALRLMLAHTICGSPYWSVKPEPQAAKSETTRESVETCAGETVFDERRRAVLGLLGFSPEEPTVIGGNGGPYGLVGLFRRLINLPDAAVMEIVAIVMGESLASGSAAVEAVGFHLDVRMEKVWSGDDAFFEQLRDREVLARMVAEVAGEAVAAANAGEKVKTLKTIIRDHLDGANGRAKVENWVPKWMVFPPDAYTARGGVGTVTAAALVAAALELDPEPDPAAPGAVLPVPDAVAASEQSGIIGDPEAARTVADEPEGADAPEQPSKTGPVPLAA